MSPRFASVADPVLNLAGADLTHGRGGFGGELNSDPQIHVLGS